jgi:hypothetical protein
MNVVLVLVNYMQCVVHTGTYHQTNTRRLNKVDSSVVQVCVLPYRVKQVRVVLPGTVHIMYRVSY